MKYTSIVVSTFAFLLALAAWLNSGTNKPASGTAHTTSPLEQRFSVSEKKETFENARSLDLPDTLFFAGERVPLEINDVRERLDRELHVNTYWHNNTIFLIKRAARWLPQIEPILVEKGVPADFKYIAVIESGLLNDVSPAGAVGFWQFIEGTAKEFGLEVTRNVDERYHPLKATQAATGYLLQAHEKFGSWTNVAASYNRGMNGIDRALENQQVDSYYDLYLNGETSRYLFRALAIREIIENPEKYGFNIHPDHLYLPEEVKYTEVAEDIPDLIAWSLENGINYKLLKHFNPWLRDSNLRVKKGKTYQIALPVSTTE
ncbi:MAG: lytic transglycosylase domain-containing protein [Cyclobacteriaceae bacterium]|nr:lytic transglycosylase domain-containing protein [Cyclobacteriaceae bacterium]